MSIKVKFIAIMSAVLVVICAGLGVIAYIISSNALVDSTRESMPKLAVEASKIVEARLQLQFSSLEDLAASPNGIKGIEPLLKEHSERMNCFNIAVSDSDGNAVYSDGSTGNIKDSSYFTKALSGDEVVTNPMMLGDKVVMIYAVPVKVQDQVVGVIIETRDGYELSNYISDIKIGTTGKAFIVDSAGTTIAHSDKTTLENIIKSTAGATDATTAATQETGTAAADKNAGTNSTVSNTKKKQSSASDFKNYDVLLKNMTGGQSGFGEYQFKKVPMYLGYAPIQTQKWSVAVQAEKSEMLSGLKKLQADILLASILFLLISMVFIYFYGVFLTRPINKLRKHTELLSKYDLSKDVPTELLKQKDEIGDLAKSYDGFIKQIRSLVTGVKTSVTETNNSAGSISELAKGLGVSASEIEGASSAVAQGATDQSRFVESVMRLIKDSNQEIGLGVNEVKKTLDISRETSDIADSGSEAIMKSIDQMASVSTTIQFATESIQNLSNRSKDIGNIVETISNIAAQTNLLALNASIEAARAGEAGRGFSVVAEEIRKLAEDSSTSSKSISNLITDIQSETQVTVNTMNTNLEKINLQLSNIYHAKESLIELVKKVKTTEAGVKEVDRVLISIDDFSRSIASAMDEIMQLITSAAANTEQVAANTEEQSATTEHMSVKAEELLRVASMLRENVEMFKLM